MRHLNSWITIRQTIEEDLYLVFGGENSEVLAKSNRDCVTVQPFLTLAGDMSMCQVIFSAADKCVCEDKRKCAAAGLKMCEVCSNVLQSTCGKAACKIDGKRPMVILPTCSQSASAGSKRKLWSKLIWKFWFWYIWAIKLFRWARCRPWWQEWRWNKWFGGNSLCGFQIGDVGACILWTREVPCESNRKKRGSSEDEMLGKAIWSKYATKYGKRTWSCILP